MPIYEYECKKCANKQEKIVKKSEDKVKCDECGSTELNRMFPTGTNFKLMGRGWPSGPQ